jgi:NDP-sugar pyrophosphorylase family protein
MTRMPPVALLAGGLATRMRPLTEKIPKSLLDVAGKPFIAHQLRLFRREGVERVVICTGYLGEMVEAFVGDGSAFGLSVAYSPDGPQPVGTGGALRQALPLLGGEFMVIYGDSWLDTEYAPIVETFRREGKKALMTVFRNENAWDVSNVEFGGGAIRRYDKVNKTPQMHFIDWGLGLLRAKALDVWENMARFDLAELYGRLVAEGQLAGYEVKQRFYEIGSHEGLKETSALLAAARPK